MTHTKETLESARQHLVSAQDFIARAMERLEPDPYAELKAAHAAGKTIQIRDELPDTWLTVEEPGWRFPVSDYRIKPEPPKPADRWQREREHFEKGGKVEFNSTPHESGWIHWRPEYEKKWSNYWSDPDPALRFRIAAPASPPAGEWREWAGGECPVAMYDRVGVKLRDGTIQHAREAHLFKWEHFAGYPAYDIIAYRVVEAAVEAAEQPCVALDPADVPPGSVLREGNSYSEAWLAILSVFALGVDTAETSISFDKLRSDGWLIKRPGEDWKPASKPAK